MVSPGLQFGMIPRYRILGDLLYFQATFMGFYYLPVITGFNDFLANPFTAYKYGGPGFEVSTQLGIGLGAFFMEFGGGGQIQSPSIRVGFTALVRGVVGARFKKRLFGAVDHVAFNAAIVFPTSVVGALLPTVEGGIFVGFAADRP